jgi:hypothetical protein
MRKRRIVFAFALLVSLACHATAQEAEVGVALPVTITAGALETHRMQGDDPRAGTVAGAFHAALYPTLKLGPHWFVYSALSLRSTPFYYYDAYYADRNLDFDVLQAFVGYTRTYRSASLLVKAGQLTSAFGYFPLHYDDADNPLLDQPLSYATLLRLRPDQLPCGVENLLEQHEYGVNVNFECGGSTAESYGLMPATVYGMPGVEIDLSVHKADARFQLTNSSPVNPQTLLSGSQHAQWTAGGGYTLAPGLRIGTSAFQGPFLDRAVAGLLPPRTNIRNFPATGAGLDVQWARGRWSTSGEWQWFRFDYPNFSDSPAASFAYAEVKAVLNARTYLALRAGFQRNSRVQDAVLKSPGAFSPDRQSYEFAIGYRPNRWQLVKVGYEWLKTAEVFGTRDNVVGIQLVTSIHSLAAALR